MKAAREEIATFFRPDRFALLAIENEETFGWIGAIKHSGHLWEMHPLVVAPQHQGKDLGSFLVHALEKEAKLQNVTTIWLGTDDDWGGTNLHGKDLYPDVLEKLTGLKSTGNHPFAFYRKLGYAVIGALPDASGPGKHDILMAKRIC